MSRKVFFSFHYDNDINRAMTVRNSWVTQGIEKAGFVDKAEFERVQRQGKSAVEKWIDDQLYGTSCYHCANWKRDFKQRFCSI